MNAWQTKTMPSASQWVATAFGNGVHVAVSMTSGTAAAKSTDGGLTWSATVIPSGVYRAVTWVPAIGLFVAVGNAICATSPDGTTWTARTFTLNAGSITFGAGLLVAGNAGLLTGTDSNAYSTSADGITWTNRTLPTSASYSNIRWCDDRFSATIYTVSGAGTYTAYTSVDGISWQLDFCPAGSSANSYGCIGFKGRRFWQVSNYVFASEALGMPTAPVNYPGWSVVGFGTHSGAQNISAAGEWLIAWAPSGHANLSTDGRSWRPVPKLPAITVQNPQHQMAYGNGCLVICDGASTANIYVLQSDPTKFRVPRQYLNDADRLYIKAK